MVVGRRSTVARAAVSPRDRDRVTSAPGVREADPARLSGGLDAAADAEAFRERGVGGIAFSFDGVDLAGTAGAGPEADGRRDGV